MPDRSPKGRDLKALKPLNVRAAESLPQLLEQMSRTSFGGRELGRAFEVLKTMADDPDCTIVVTVSGAMSVAKMSWVLCEMIELDVADLIVSTGAFLAHEIAQALGGRHYVHDSRVSDEVLSGDGFNRVYDSLELDDNLTRVDEFVLAATACSDEAQPRASFEIHQVIGQKLVEAGHVPSVLGSAYQKGIPIYAPAFTDSGMGVAMAIDPIRRASSCEDIANALREVPSFNPFLDVFDYTRRIASAKRLGIFTIGGGVPRNWAQQVGPFVDTINYFTGSKFEVPRFRYGIRICPEPEHWGGLSGCTYSEGVTWGKFVPEGRGGEFAEVHCDATIAWPILIRAMIEHTRR